MDTGCVCGLLSSSGYFTTGQEIVYLERVDSQFSTVSWGCVSHPPLSLHHVRMVLPKSNNQGDSLIKKTPPIIFNKLKSIGKQGPLTNVCCCHPDFHLHNNCQPQWRQEKSSYNMTAPIVANVILQQTEPRFIYFFNYNEGRKGIVAKKRKTSHPERKRKQTGSSGRDTSIKILKKKGLQCFPMDNKSISRALLTICYTHRPDPALIYMV